ncbi:MAG: VacJ family lipoprotein [Syntrophaceae bacterium]|nr:VacJ family lipoprotein [Syntrophaceae bacterium]
MTFLLSRTCPFFVVALYLVLFLSGCAVTRTSALPPEEPARHTVAEFSDDERIADIADPWEGFNRSMYNFNYRFDKYFFLPVVRGYEFVVPTFARKGISNFFGNIGEFRTLYNSAFQLKGKKFLITFGRFLANSTIGIGGLLDPATPMGLAKQNEGFGQTLGHWNVDSGPYLVLPVLGPNNLRSAGGSAVDAGIRYALISVIDPLKGVDHGEIVLAGTSALEAVDARHRVPFRYYESGFPFEYDFIRFLYSKWDEMLLMK